MYKTVVFVLILDDSDFILRKHDRDQLPHHCYLNILGIKTLYLPSCINIQTKITPELLLKSAVRNKYRSVLPQKAFLRYKINVTPH